MSHPMSQASDPMPRYRILCCVFPFWSVERQLRDLGGRSWTESGAIERRSGDIHPRAGEADRRGGREPGREPGRESGRESDRERGRLLPAESLDSSAVDGCRSEGRGEGRWRHPRAMSRVWVPDDLTHPMPQDAAQHVSSLDNGLASRITGRAILVVQAKRGVRTVIATCRRGLRDGVRPGMTLVQAQALLCAHEGPTEGHGRGAIRGGQSQPSRSSKATPPHTKCPIGKHLESAPRRGDSFLGEQDFAGVDADTSIVVEHDPRRDAAALRALATRLLLVVPTVALRTLSDAVDESIDLDAASSSWRTPGEAVVWGDLTGCERLLEQRYGGEEGFLDSLQHRLERRGWTVRVAIGPTPGIGWAVARFARSPDPGNTRHDQTESSASTTHARSHSSRIILPGGEAEAIRELPIECLRLRREEETALREVQVERVQHLLDISRIELGERFRGEGESARANKQGRAPKARPRSGSRRLASQADPQADQAPKLQGQHTASHAASRCSAEYGSPRPHSTRNASSNLFPSVLHRLDQCLGTLPEPLVPLRAHPTYRVRHSFDAPIQHPEAIELITVDLIDQLCRSVQRSERGISRIRWTAERTHARPLVVTFDLSIPTRQRDQLWALLHPHLERLPIEMSGHGFGNARKRSKRRRTQRHAGHDGHAGERDNPVPAGETTLRVASDGIDAIVLEALRTLSVPHHQVGLMPTGLQQAACNRASWSRLSDGMPNETQHLAPTALDPAALACADRISARLGRQRVLCGAHQASHEPERAWERVPWDAVLKVGGQFGQGITRDRHGITMGSHEAYGGREGASLPPHAPRGDRPPWLLDPPQLVLVTRGATEDRPSLPVFQWRFQWRGHLYRIIESDGWECLMAHGGIARQPQPESVRPAAGTAEPHAPTVPSSGCTA